MTLFSRFAQTVVPKLKRKRTGYLFTLPTIVIILAITIFPLIYSIRMTFFSYYLSSGQPPAFLGLKNWIDAFSDRQLWQSFLVTARIVIPALILEFVIGFALALLLNRKLRGRGLIIGLLSTPVMIAPAAAGLAFRLLYSPQYGPLNEIIGWIVGRTVHIDWLGSKYLAIYSVTLVDIWQEIPFIMLVLLAGLSAIPDDVMEASRIDGASVTQTFAYVTLPLLQPVIAVAVLIRAIDLLKFFDLVFILTMGGPASSTESVSFFAYIVGIRTFRIGYGATVSYIILIVAAIMVTVLVRLLKREERL